MHGNRSILDLGTDAEGAIFMKHAVTIPDTGNQPLEYQRQQSFPLRLPPSIWFQVKLLANREGVSLNQYISQAIGEKMTRLKSSPYHF